MSSPIAWAEDNLPPSNLLDIEMSSPNIKAESASPEIRSESASPDIKLESASPEIKSKSASPDIKSESASPEIKSESASPEIRSESSLPEIRSERDSPPDRNLETETETETSSDLDDTDADSDIKDMRFNIYDDLLSDNDDDVLGELASSQCRKVQIEVQDDDSVKCYLVSQKHIWGKSHSWDSTIALGRESGRTGIATIFLKGVNPRAMFLVLCVMHKNVNMLPTQVTHKELMDLAHIARRFDLNRTLKPVLDRWLSVAGPYSQLDAEDWLTLAYQFGMESDYLSLVNHLATSCRINKRRKLLSPQTKTPLKPVEIDRAHSCISAVREQTLGKLYKVARDVIELMITRSTCQLHPQGPDAEQIERNCTARNHHSLRRHLHSKDMHIYDFNKHVKHSVQDVMDILMDSSINQYTSFPGQEEHDEPCSIVNILRERTLQIYEDMPQAADRDIILSIRDNAIALGRRRVSDRLPHNLILTMTRGSNAEHGMDVVVEEVDKDEMADMHAMFGTDEDETDEMDE